MKKQILLAFVLLTSVVFSQHADNYSYHPYPIVLVHGFSQIPVEPFGLPTYKKALTMDGDEVDEKDDKVLSTQIDTSLNAFDKDRIGWTMIEAFGADTSNGQKQYWDYHPAFLADSVTWKYFDTLDRARFYPHEDNVLDDTTRNQNYTGLNHSFVELYCNYYQFESNDGNYKDQKEKLDIEEPTFSAYGVDTEKDAGYNIVDGGQSQILRVRLIQVLNEYYGDFKWLNDPSAKINVVAYSNGGSVITWLLKEENTDEAKWLNGGKNGNDVLLSEFVDGLSDSLQEVIDGKGIRLSEHINQVITIDSPFRGVPWSYNEEYTLISPAGVYLTGAITSIFSGAAVAIGTHHNPGVKIGIKAGISIPSVFLIKGIAIGVASGFLAGVLSSNLFYHNYYDATKGGVTPLSLDVYRNSSFNQRFEGDGIQPLYHNNEIIPYTNIIGETQNIASIFYISGGILTTLGVVCLIPQLVPIYNPPASAFLFGTSVGLFMIGGWYGNSDFIVSTKSQSMKTPYPNAVVRTKKYTKRLRKKGFSSYHVAIVKNIADSIPEFLDRFPPTLEVTHAIGSFQYDTLKLQSGDSIYRANDIPTTTVQNDSTKWDENLRGAPFKKGVRFDYMTKDLVDENEAWPISKGDKIVTNGTIGPPAYIVGKLNSYYMNRTKLEVRVNIDQWSEVDFYKDTGNGEFGNYASMYVDMNGDSVIDEADANKLSQLNSQNVTHVTA